VGGREEGAKGMVCTREWVRRFRKIIKIREDLSSIHFTHKPNQQILLHIAKHCWFCIFCDVQQSKGLSFL
jgi:hypothetical protein